MPKPPAIVRVAVPSPLRGLFDYRLDAASTEPTPVPGARVAVNFGRRACQAVVMETAVKSALPRERIKPVQAITDAEPVLPDSLLNLLSWAADYYQHPLGEVVFGALPALLRQGKPAEAAGEDYWQLTDEGRAVDVATLKRAPRQAALLQLLAETTDGLSAPAIDAVQSNWRPVMRGLVNKGWVAVQTRPSVPPVLPVEADVPPALNEAQQTAVRNMVQGLGQFGVFLVDGVTGSGKTEVYLSLIEAVLARGEQVLVLVPEIGLTPQLVQRFRARFAVPIAILHSGLTDRERLDAWLAAKQSEAPIVIGTRSAVFTPFAKLGLIILDEEHDASFKQQEGFRYSARDVAVKRAQLESLPVVLGSATPSLETLHNALQGRYQHLVLPERAGAASHPKIDVLDMCKQPISDGLSTALVNAMRRHLDKGGQVLLFLNRRGYAPTLLCHDCGWVSKCRRCDAHMTLFNGNRRLRCHHCGAERPAEPQCPECTSTELRPVGAGTERLEERLQKLFPDIGIARIDRDSTRRKGALQSLLDSVHAGENRILVGTQMLAKGHHFPDVTLVGIVDVDQGLFSADFRATERMAQLIVQVAGRAGRADKPGQVLIQTHHPEHPLLQVLLNSGYATFAKAALEERRQAQLPPFSYLALLRAEAADGRLPLQFLQQAREQAEALGVGQVFLLGPIPAPMERRAGRVRAQLMLQAPSRAELHRLLTPWLQQLDNSKLGRKVRWSIDVDPQDTF
jgi:primosomal protein N' (replication factor Y)